MTSSTDDATQAAIHLATFAATRPRPYLRRWLYRKKQAQRQEQTMRAQTYLRWNPQFVVLLHDMNAVPTMSSQNTDIPANPRNVKPTLENPTIRLYDTLKFTLAFWSTNADEFSFPSKVPERLRGESAMMYGISYSQLLSPQWYYRHRQHWPFIPLRVDYRNRFIAQLNFYSSTLPIVRATNGEFCLFPEVAEAWHRHEQLVENLVLYFDQNAYARPMTIEAITWPRQHKYHESHEDEKLVRRRCMLALLRFREHWGMLAYAAFGRVSWEATLERATEDQKKMGIDPSLIPDLRASGILDVDAPRVGALVDIWDADYPFPINRANRYAAPMWYLFARVEYKGNREYDIIPRYDSYYETQLNPNPETASLIQRLRDILDNINLFSGDIEETVADFEPIPSSPSEDTDIWAEGDSPVSPYAPLESSSSDNEPCPLPLPGSGQLPNQNWDAFFPDRYCQNRLDECLESRAQKAQRLARLDRIDVSGAVPPRENDSAIYKLAFFEWVPCDRKGFLLRKPISFSEASAVWPRYTATQRQYDSHRHEIDLCSMLGRKLKPQIDDSPMDDMTDDVRGPIDHEIPEYAQDRPCPQKGKEPIIPEPTDQELSVIGSISDRIVARRDQRLASLPEGVNWVQWRFGFHFPENTPIPTSTNNWRITLNAGLVSTSLKGANDPFISEFASLLQEKEISATDQDLLMSYIDISPSHPSYLDPSTSFLGVEKIVLRQSTGSIEAYRLYPQEESSEKDFPWMFVVEEASSVVLAIRHGWGFSRDLLTAKFMEHCIPFHTLAVERLNLPRRPIELPDLVKPLPVVDKEALFMDYSNYEASREEFFSGPRGRAIVRYGGTIRRLYRADELQTPHRLQQVISGPTLLAFIMGETYTYEFNGERITVCEDALTEGELVFACGQYCPRPGKAPECKASWYVPFSYTVKLAIGRNGGIWNNREESDHGKRLQQILEKTSEPLSVNKWKQRKPNSKALAAERHYEALCVAYLDEYIETQSTVDIRPLHAQASAPDGFIPMSRRSS
ncbi:hypothetical protein GALMADRAFT_210075 [Galerina marginata CBS 339.88]|uniref:Uncharacterized protein n=1 Tax=Galerina marginata (strain CBS 339.88) TaxID=685588 RepID=A0A067T680_GALM3|nr:hypothetical protein GALMADRAFT_210075 [Galerina marginata CBS 339.88]